MYFLDDIYFSWVSSTPATPLTSPVLTNKVDLTMECIGCGNSFTPGKSTQLRCKPNCKGKPVNSGQCAYCAKAFTSMDPRKKYCSKNCQHAQYKKSFGISGNYPGISTERDTLKTVIEVLAANRKDGAK